MLQKLQIKNYRSIADASVELQPFTILLGANGSGKSNLLKLLAHLSRVAVGEREILARHLRTPDLGSRIDLITSAGQSVFDNDYYPQANKPPELAKVRVFSIDPAQIGGSEGLVPAPDQENGGIPRRPGLETTAHRQAHQGHQPAARAIVRLAPGRCHGARDRGRHKALDARGSAIPGLSPSPWSG